MKITIVGNTPSQKNGKQIAYNPRTGRSFIMSNKNVLAWHRSAATQLEAELCGRRPMLKGPLTITATFFRDTRRKYDLDNAYGTVADALVRAGFMEDDNNTVVECVILKDGGHDKLFPRVELLIDY